MAKKSKDADSTDLSYEGCYGERVTYEELGDFLDEVFIANVEAEKSNSQERFATCIWGHSGIGKTAMVKQRAAHPVKWSINGGPDKEYPGYRVYNVPIAQMEEMGDFHGMPDKHVRVTFKGREMWVPTDVLNGYLKDGWELDHTAGVRTMYAPPDWVPREPGPSILLLDDWNRPSVRIIKGLMQLLQNYGMVSWQLPPGCNIIMTGNPDEQDYLVTSIDKAILTRVRSVTLKHDAKEWAIWAQANGVDPRLINFVLMYPEMMIGPERTNPRTLAEFGRMLKRLPEIKSKDDQKRFVMLGNSLLDEDTVRAVMVFFERDVEMVAEPKAILAGESWIPKHITKMMTPDTRGEKRIDVVSVTCDRLFAHIAQPDAEISDRAVANFQAFLTLKDLPDDLRHSVCMRVARAKDATRIRRWIVGSKELTRLIMDVM